MQRMTWSALAALAFAQHVAAAGVVRIADGDCVMTQRFLRRSGR